VYRLSEEVAVRQTVDSAVAYMSDRGSIAIDMQERDGSCHVAIRGFGLTQFIDISIRDLDRAPYQIGRWSVGFGGKSLFDGVRSGLAGDFARLSPSNSIEHRE